MATSEGSPICFRVNAAERAKLEAVASAQGQTLSAFVRSSCLDMADVLLQQNGAEATMARYEERQRHLAEQQERKLQAARAGLGLAPAQPGTRD